MNINELREYQYEFEKIRNNYQSGYKEINKLRKKFTKDFPINRISNLSLEQYVTGKGEKTFCNRIENELNPWGNIHGSFASKFSKLSDLKGVKPFICISIIPYTCNMVKTI